MRLLSTSYYDTNKETKMYINLKSSEGTVITTKVGSC